MTRCLENITLGLLALLLLQLLDVNVLPNKDTCEAERHKASAGNDHLALHITICTNNGIALWCAVQKRLLNLDIAKDGAVICFSGLGKTHEQLLGKNVVPHGTSNGETNG